MAGKHAPIELGKYVEIHGTAMRALERKRMVLPGGGDSLAFDRTPAGLLIAGRIECVGGVAIDVEKVLSIDGEGEGAIVQTISYTYHAQIKGLGNLLRYCGPHKDHNCFHHKHSFNLLTGDVVGTLDSIDEENRPTLAEVIEEACNWYFEHASEVESRKITK